MRHKLPPSPALGRQLAEWRRPLDEDPDVDEAVTRMLRALDRFVRPDPRDRERDRDVGFSPSAAD